MTLRTQCPHCGVFMDIALNQNTNGCFACRKQYYIDKSGVAHRGQRFIQKIPPQVMDIIVGVSVFLATCYTLYINFPG